MKIKQYKNGLVIGKFYPLHKGHCYLIDYAQEKVEKLTVIICHTNDYKIPVNVRASWIRELYPSVKLIVYKHYPILDSNSTKVSELWAKITIKLLGYAPEVVFTSEEYGDRYSHFMGSKHILVDIKRDKFKVSGTKVRENPFKYWDFLPDPVKAYFTKRVVVLGAESTGTTTLSKDLANHYKTTWVPEYGRTYYEGKMFAKNYSTWTTDEFIHIAKKQKEIENALARKSNKLLICDTDPLATSIWHQRYTGKRSLEIAKLVKPSDYVLYILTDTDIPFIQDGTRDGENLREWMHQLFVNELKSRKVPYIIVSGNKKTRLEAAVNEIDKLIFKSVPNTFLNDDRDRTMIRPCYLS